MITQRHICFLFFMIGLLLFASGCTLTEGMIEKTGDGVSKVQLANSVKGLTDGRKERIKGEVRFFDETNKIIESLPPKERAVMVDKSLTAKVDIAKNTFWRGFWYAFAFLAVFGFVVAVVKYWFDRKYPKKKAIHYG